MPRKSLHSSINKLSYKSLFIILFFLLISIVVLWKFVLPNHKVSAAWWDDGWNYRKAVTITNNTSFDAINIPYKISLDTASLISTGKLQVDSDDIRIVDQNGKIIRSQVEKKTLNTSTTRIWFEATVKSNSSSSYYIYYGNPSATAPTFESDISTFSSTAAGTTIEMKDGFGYSTLTGAARTTDIRKNGTNLGVDGNIPYSSSYPGAWWNGSAFTQTVLNSTGPLFVEVTYGAGTTGSYSSYGTNIKIFDNGFAETQFFVNYNTSGSENFYYYLSFDSGTRNSVWINGSGTLVDQDADSGNLTEASLGQNWFGQRWTSTGNYGGTIITKNGSDWTNGGTSTRASYYQTNYSYSQSFTSGSSREVRFGVFAGNGGLSEMQQKGANYGALVSSLTTEEAGGGPIAYWKFDEGTGTTAYDSTSNQNNGSFLSAPVWKNESECVFGKCLAFDNVDDGVSINNNFTDLTDYTMCAWINIKGNHKNYSGTIMSSGNWNNSYWGFTLNQANTRIEARKADGVNTPTWNYTFSLNKWTHVCITRANTKITVYTNGKQIGSPYTGATGNIGSTASNTTIGRETYASGYFAFNGWIDEPKIYRYARTADQIKLDYNSRGSLKGTSANLGSAASDNNLSDGLVGYWKMDEGTGTSISDSSGLGYTGTFGTGDSAPTWSSGKFGVGTSFDGSNDYINFGNPGLSSLSNATISFWRKAPNSSAWLLFQGQDGNYYVMATSGSGAFYHNNIGSATKKIYIDGQIATTPLTDTNWHHYVITGVNLSTWTNLRLSNYPNFQYNGIIDEVRIYNRAISSAEVSQLYEYAPGPVGYWDLDEASGITAKDKSGNNNNGTLNSSSSWIQGKYGSAGNFNGTSDRVGILYSPILSPTESITFSAWAYKNNWTSAEASRIISKTEGGGYTLLFSNSIIYAYAYRNGAYATPNTSTSGLSPGWHYFTGSYDGRYTKIYIDGILKNTDDAGANYPLTYAYNNALFVGAEADSNNDQTPDINAFFTGKIDDVKIYNYTRTQKQIIEDMTGGAPAVSSKSMIAYYNFDEGFGTNTYDFSPSKNNAVIAGTTLPTWQSSCAKGKCLSFPGGAYMSGYVQANSSIPLSNVFTISHWIKTSSSGYSISNSGGGNGYRLGTFGGKVQFLIGNSSNLTETSCGTKTVNDNKWHLIDGIYDNTNRKFTCYIDGKYESTVNTVDFTGFSTVAPMIGGYNYNGLIDEVKFYNYALTADEIKQDYNQGSALQMGQTSQTIGGTTTSLDYCIPGDTSYCASPIAEWKFDEKNGTVAYDTGSTANNGNLGPGGSAPTWIQGKIGSGLQFDGVDDRVGLGSTLSLGNTDWTVSAWIKTSSNGTNTLISNSSGGPVANLLGTINSKIVYYHYNSGWLTESGTSNIADGKWHYLTWANHSNQTIDLYVDGVGETLGASSTVMNTGPVNQIGRNWSTSSNASIDQVRIYNYARTPAQIAYDYNKGGPIGWWKFDECQGGTAYDWSGIGTTGVINIGPSGTQTSVGTCTDGLSTSAWNNGKTGKLNSSLNFDGTDDYVNLSNQSRLQMRTGAITVSQWIKLTGTTNYRSIFFGGGTGGATGYGLAFNSGSTSIRYETMGSTGGRQVFIVNGGITLNNWYHVVAIFDGINNQMKLYVNGQEKHSASISDPGIVTNNSNFSIGSYNASQDWFFPGQIDDVRVFNYALTSEQIKTVYNNGSVNFN